MKGGIVDEDTEIPVNILVVDDRAENRVALKALLDDPSYRILEAASSTEALRHLLEEEFAVLLIDVLMPGVNGFELATTIKQRERTAAVPIIFLTALVADLDLIYKGYRAGAVDYLFKPLLPEMVRAKVAVFAQLYRQRKQIERQGHLLLEGERRDNDIRLLEYQLASERHYRSLAEAVPDIIWTARPDGLVDYFNHRWFEYTGISAERAGGSWFGAVHPDDLGRCRDAWHEAIGSGQMRELDCRLLRASDGEFRWHLCRAVPERGAAGQIVSWHGTFTDIEDQRRAHAVLLELKGMLDAVLDAVLIFDPADWHFFYVNQGASALLDYSREELLRMRPIDFLANRDRESLAELVASLRERQETVTTIETKFRRRDGRTVPVELSLQLIPIEGGRVVSIARDITERRRMQVERDLLYREAVDAIRARDEFFSVASHELRTPLSALHLQLDILLQPPRPDAPRIPDQTRAKLQLVSRQVERLSSLVTELLDVSRISAGRMRLDREPVELVGLVRDVADRFADEAARAGCTINVHAREPVHGIWDRLRIEQVVTNLLTNAFKFGSGKPIELGVQLAGALGRFTITDHGIGIAAEDVDRIFHRFEQATSSSAHLGLGLGLYIVRGIVDAHGGTIRVDSQLGAGTTFTVELPCQLAREDAPRDVVSS